MLSLWEHNPPQLEPLRANMRQVEPEVLPPQLTSLCLLPSECERCVGKFGSEPHR